jgi:hypothetical protein
MPARCSGDFVDHLRANTTPAALSHRVWMDHPWRLLIHLILYQARQQPAALCLLRPAHWSLVVGRWVAVYVVTTVYLVATELLP